MTMRMLISILFLLSFPLAAEPPAAQFELASVPLVSQAASRLDNAIAPRFRDTAAAATLVLTLGATRYGMDLTRPLEIHFYSFGEKPAMRIIAYALPEIKDPLDNAEFWGLRFRARRKGGLIAFDTAGLPEPFPQAPPGRNLKKGELLRGAIRTGEVHRHFQFRSFNSRNGSSRLILNGLDELLTELRDAGVIFSADENGLQLELTFRPQDQSALLQWMKQPLPPKGEVRIFPGTTLISVLRLPPTKTLKEYGKTYLMQGENKAMPKSLPNAVTGFAAMAIRNAGTNSSVRLAVGIDPSRAGSVRREIRALDYTPYRDWFQLRRRPPLFCSETGNQVIFCGLDQLDRTALENLFRPQSYSGTIPDRPFICLDLRNPDRPLAELRFEKDSMQLILQASDSWFSDCRPLLEKPLLLPGK